MTQPNPAELYTHTLDNDPLGGLDQATLFGVTVEEYKAECRRQSDRLEHGSFIVPHEWMAAARRHHREAAAALGHNPTVHEVLAYLKAQRQP